MQENSDLPVGARDDRDRVDLRGRRRRAFNAVAGGLTCLAAAVVIGIFFTFVVPIAGGTIGFELVKFAIQFLLIVALGAFVAVGVESIKRRMDAEDRRLQYEVDTLMSVLGRVDNLYQTIKRERHALAIIQLSKLTYDDYMARMSQLREIKQDAERTWREVEALERWIDGLETVRVKVHEMETRLDPAENEWENLAKAPEIFGDARLRELGRFRSGENYLGAPYYDARAVLIEQISRRHDRDRRGRPWSSALRRRN